MNNYPNLQANSVFPSAPSAGYDTGSPGGTFTAWSTTLGIQIAQPSIQSTVWLWYWCGATAAGVYQVLVDEAIGATGQPAPATLITGTIAASTSGWIGPWSPSTFNQTQPTNFTYTGAINTTALTASAVGNVVVDFTTTTTLSVRAYQVIPVN